FPTDTTRSAIQLIKNGVLDRHPTLNIILPHGGGNLPYHAARLTHVGTPLGYGIDATTVRRALNRLYYDTAGPMSPYQTPTLLAATASSHILFGTDYNALPASAVPALITAFNTDPALNPGTRRRISRDNALDLFPGIASKIGR
ncbi:MAG: amidohydrolase family protein, partial [Frankia sp.]|nr:amidohydrolase family protein [Frankia sp.]